MCKTRNKNGERNNFVNLSTAVTIDQNLANWDK